jgi:hypothetical protein
VAGRGVRKWEFEGLGLDVLEYFYKRHKKKIRKMTKSKKSYFEKKEKV